MCGVECVGFSIWGVGFRGFDRGDNGLDGLGVERGVHLEVAHDLTRKIN